MTYKLYSKTIQLHFSHHDLEKALNPFLTKLKPEVHIYLNWMPFDAFLLHMQDTNQGISYAINYETFDIYLRTKSKDVTKALLMFGISTVIRALSYPLHMIPLKKQVFYKDHIMYIGYVYKLNDHQSFMAFDHAMIGSNKTNVFIYPNIFDHSYKDAAYQIKAIHILDDVVFNIDPIEGMRYVMPYLEIPRKSKDLMYFQETLKHIKSLPKIMI